MRIYDFFCLHGRTKCATHVPMLFIAITFFCITLLCKTKNFYWFEKAASRHWKIYIMKKLSGHTHTYRVASRIYRITSSSSSRFAWYESRMNIDESGRKENVTYTRHANTCIIKWVTKRILTNMLPNLFINNICFFIMKNK